MKRVGPTVICMAMAAGLVAGCATNNPWPKSRSQIVETAPACEDFAVQIYFETESAALTNEARSVLKGAGALAKGCKVASARVIGLSDAVGGGSNSNLALSRKRADTVKAALDKIGFRDVAFEVGAAGDAGATTSGGEARPLRRRADIKFDLDGPLR
uniref:OmpA/MotB domain protein n=1 Tax=Caulobacter sp. (strain K31) TaxID=366602 RepID=B0T255_CAUSK